MADIKSHMFRHLRSAKVWLTRAEESFDKDSTIRGELDLLLAQAELQHARETSHSQQWRYKYPVLRHVVSLALATAIVAVGFGAYWLSSDRNVTRPVPLAAQEPKSVPVAKAVSEFTVGQVQAEEPRSAPVAVNAPLIQPVAQPVERQEKAERVRTVEKENLVPPDEMQKLIRAAGRSLRGQ